MLSFIFTADEIQVDGLTSETDETKSIDQNLNLHKDNRKYIELIRNF